MLINLTCNSKTNSYDLLVSINFRFYLWKVLRTCLRSFYSFNIFIKILDDTTLCLYGDSNYAFMELGIGDLIN